MDSVHSISGIILGDPTMHHDSTSFVGGRDLNNDPNVQYNNTYTL